ncbi:MAG: hypothetical protein IJ662_00490 [Clostridia bacterium]|nr:hypothetical protein [Clostridia bacterium]
MRNQQRKIIVFSILALFVVLYSLYQVNDRSVPDQISAYYGRHQAELMHMADQIEKTSEADLHAQFDPLLGESPFESFSIQDGFLAVNFTFSSTYIQEGVIRLIWFPQDIDPRYAVDISRMRPGDTMRINGSTGGSDIGIGGKGFLEYNRLEEHWYIVTEYLPT